MNPTAEVRTMDKAGFAEFLAELKRAKYRHQVPFTAFEAKMLALRNKNARAFRRATPAQRHAHYEKYINDCVALWEKDQQAVVEKARVPKPATNEENELLSPTTASMFAGQIAALNAKNLAIAFNSIQFYLGKLNRDVNQSRVDAYGADMQAGRWWFTPDPIVVTDEGNIINGQHRLLAVEQYAFRKRDELAAGTFPQFVVVWGVDKRAAILMDEARRSATDRRDIALRFAAAK